MTQLLGCLLLSLPFIGVFAMAWHNISLKAAVSIFTTATAIVLTVTAGVALLHG